MSNRKGRLFVVSGPSGVGKTTLIERFLEEDGNSRFSVSCTTREKRGQEKNGKDYYFIDEATFKEMIGNGGFLEWEEVHGYLYGTPVREVREPVEKGIDVILDIDVKGALKVREECEAACLIFIEPPSVDELIRRLSLRGEREIVKRMERVRQEMDRRQFFTYKVKNDKLEQAYQVFKSVITTVREQGYGKDNC